MGKNVLVVAATPKEIQPFLDNVRQSAGLVAGHTIDVLISGVGLTSATYHLTRQVLLKRPQFIIQAGIAGCFTKNTVLGSVAVVRQDCIADEAVMESGKLKTVFDLRLNSAGKFPFSGGWLINENVILKKLPHTKVRAISVNHITTSEKMIELYRKKFNPAIESMEGAALQYVALSEKIPFIQLRAVSNYIGERDKKRWNMKEAIVNLNNDITAVLNIL